MKQQEERKRKRQEKQVIKKMKSKKKRPRRESSSSSSEDEEREIVLDDSEDDLLLEEDNCCAACLGSENWTVGSAWIGCSNARCSKWFHKACISEDIINMTAEQLRAFEFYCNMCKKRRNKNLH